MNIIESLNIAEAMLANAGSQSARLDAEVLLAHILNCERIYLYTNRNSELNPDDLQKFEDYIKRRADHMPVAYITGTKEFWSMPVMVTDDVLVPRPETELLVDKALSCIKDENDALHILDLCTGSGNIPMALASELPNARFVATDISEKAIDLAKENTSFATARINFRVGDLFDAVSNQESFDMITANPPYARPSDKHLFSQEVLKHEPQHAVFGGISGLDFIERIIEDAPVNLKPGAYLILEIGIDQSEDLRKLVGLNSSYESIKIDRDLAGIERIATIRKRWKS